MFGFMKSPANKPPKQKSIDSSNPFESDTESENKNTITPARRTSSEPILVTPDFKSNNFDDDDDDDYFGRGPPSKNKQKKDLETMSVQELEGYAVNQAEDTTKSVNNCVKIAEDIRQDATRTLDVLHQQDDNDRGKRASKEQREKLGLAPAHKGSRTPPPEPTNALQKVEVEKAKQDDALSDLSNILGDLKGMAVGMGSELDNLYETGKTRPSITFKTDVDELNSRVKGANQRARRLIGK
ncbi:putative SNAP25-like proteinous protein SNAP30 [Forsythia ovata]|uniref:SNAP25-like proteinous protein SNAP30 n=1 Tax=Forsythia ovata TaxID=205694 RepID=A0ABD1WAH8_9LAMI